ncbi:hypothetical protein [Streptomyces canus]|uniref:Uncharacterized protein n=1 Tax=Streptomyces canus TaxID=58343 RepID=A0AAW8FVG6_9ACTN|nr:hypothetical protein [Streptomyces canus]MDQ0757777.1 hypothetical protein [Streptomyces canus]MDQ0913709.1 hypothetical protein [Streptomyces canus]MDQ1073275.1 hypothetical protein [Streptomyces canus]
MAEGGEFVWLRLSAAGALLIASVTTTVISDSGRLQARSDQAGVYRLARPSTVDRSADLPAC